MDRVLAADTVTPGAHWTGELLGLTFDLDTILAVLVTGVVLCGLGLVMAHGAAAGRPSGLQVLFEALLGWVQGQVEEQMGRCAPRGVIGLAVTLFAFILVCNLLGALPSEHYLPPPTADVNLAYPLMLLVIIWVNVAGIRARGVGRYYLHIAKKGPFEIITQFAGRPASMALRLWGNIFAGSQMVALIGLLPPVVLWLPNAVWKLFDIGIGVIQAFIFALLTIIYFAEAVER